MSKIDKAITLALLAGFGFLLLVAVLTASTGIGTPVPGPYTLAGRIEPGGALSSPSRTNRAVSSRCTAGHRFAPSPG